MEENQKRQKTLDKNTACEDKLFQVLGVTRGANMHTDEILRDATMGHFGGCCLSDELTAFCKARLKPTESSSAIPKKKGKLESAEQGKKNLIGVAYQFRTRKVLLTPKKVPQELQSSYVAAQPVFCTLQQPGTNEMPTIEDFSWLTRSWLIAAELTFYQNLHRKGRVATLDCKALSETATILLKHLRQRMKSHLQNRLGQQKTMREHWIWQWVELNLPNVTVLLTFLGLIMDDDMLRCARGCDCLLKNIAADDTSCFHKANEECQEEGCYLYFDHK